MPTSSNQPEPSPPAPRDLFLSYHSRDRAAILRVQQLLHERNISTFFDRDQLSAGSRWVSLLESEVGSSRAVAVFIGPHGLGDWQEMEMQLALVRQIDEQKAGRQFPIIPLILPGATPERELGFLKLYTWVDLRARLDDPPAVNEAIDELERAVRGNARTRLVEAAVELCPYRALQAFREQDEKLFFGRDRCAEQLLQQARNERLKLIAVVGPSGSGKSSVVQAGLLPRLRRERPPHLSWEAAIFTPGKAPFHNLAQALVNVGTPEQDSWVRLSKAEELGQKLADGHIRLEAAIATALAEAPGAQRLLLIVDQAEELFTQTPEQERQPFIGRLLAAASAAPVTIVLTLRADFYGQAIGFSSELGELITAGQVNILPMSRDELRQAIVAPAASVALQFEDGLVERLLDHVADQPGQLPLLEYALTELWNRRQGKLLTNAAYQEIGGVEGAISRRAEEQFNRLSPAQQETAQRVLTRLVRVAAATEEGTDTRQRVRLSELDASAREVVRTFADARLLVTNRIESKDEATGDVTSEETVEVAHEALIRSWQRLKDLLNRDRQFLLWRQRLDMRLKEWQRTGRDAGALLRGVLLEEAKRWLRDRTNDLNRNEQEFIQQSTLAARKSRRWITANIALLVVAVLTAFAWKLWDDRPESQIEKVLSRSSRIGLSPRIGLGTPDPTKIKATAAWLNTLVLTDRSSLAFETVKKIEDANSRSEVMASLVTTLAKINKIDEALKTARNIEDEYLRCWAMLSIVKSLMLVNKTDEAVKVTREVVQITNKSLETSRSMPPSLYAYALFRPGSHAIFSIIKVLADAGKTNEALEAVNEIKPEGPRYGSMLSIVAALAKTNRISQALEVASQIKDVYVRPEALKSIVKALAEAGKADEALEVARKIEDIRLRAQATVGIPVFFDVAVALAKAGKADEVFEAARIIEDTTSNPSPTESIIEALAKANLIDEALKAANKIENADSRSRTMISITKALAEAGKVDEALEMSRKVEDTGSQAWVMGDVIKAMAKAGRMDEALRAARKIELVYSRTQALANVLAVLAADGRADEAEMVANEVFETARKFEEARKREFVYPRSQLMADPVISLARAGKAAEAFEAASTIEDTGTRSKVEISITAVLATVGKADEAFEAARKIKDADSRSRAMAELTRALAKTGKIDKAEVSAKEAFKAARQIEEARYRSQAMLNVAEAMSKSNAVSEAKNVLYEARLAALEVTTEEEKSWSLAQVAVWLAKLHYYRLACETAELCAFPADKLTSNAAILREYYLEHHPDQAHLFAEEKPD